MELKEKVVVITGSSTGIGATTAIAFAKAGSKVVINSKTNIKGGEAIVKKIKKAGGQAFYIQADVSDPNQISKMFKMIEDKYSTVDILINNAAIPNDKIPYLEAGYEDILELVNTDLIDPMMCTKHALIYMQKQGYGKILNTSSIRGAEHGGRSIAYAASKAGLNSFTKSLAKMVGPNIQVNAVAPGFVKTRNYDNLSQDLIDSFMDQTYLKRFVTEQEIADAFLFLANNDAMTGQVIYVDAGFTLK